VFLHCFIGSQRRQAIRPAAKKSLRRSRASHDSGRQQSKRKQNSAF
jgi:hypothetical protein